MRCLTKDEIQKKLELLDGWVLEDSGQALLKTYTFADFVEAFGFMVRVALVAEKMDHHPDWTNVYNRVSVRLNTHDAGGVTLKDFALLEKMEVFA